MNEYDDNNVFSKILRSEIPYKKVIENKHTLSFLDINPQAKIHVLIIPKNPYLDFHNFNSVATSEEILFFWKLVNEIIELKDLSTRGYRIITNAGKDGNQDVPHFHVHLLGGNNLGRMIS